MTSLQQDKDFMPRCKVFSTLVVPILSLDVDTYALNAK